MRALSLSSLVFSSLTLSLISALAAGCGGGASCVEGMSIACACAGGATGVQVCRAGAYEACQCGPEVDGGGLPFPDASIDVLLNVEWKQRDS